MPRVIITLISLFILATATSVLAARKHVMIVNSYHADYPWVMDHNNALKNGLKKYADLSFFHMDTKRLPKGQHQLQADLAFAAIETTHPDLVVLTDDYALKSLGMRISAQNIPVVFIGINNNPRAYLDDMAKATGVLERPLLKRSIVYIRDILFGNSQKYLVLFDNGLTAQTSVKQVFQGKDTLVFDNMTTNIKLHSRFDQWQKTVLNAKKDGYEAIILGLYHTLIDENGKHVDAESVATWTSAHSPVPVFGFWDFSIGKGLALGGLVLHGKPQGEEAVKLIRRILNGQDPHSIPPVTAESGRLIFSRSELKRWNITLPKHFYTSAEPVTFVE